MTSIMHPGTYARMNAVQAKQALADAATVLRTGTSVNPGQPSIGVPADQAAILHAERGIRHIGTALGVQNQVSSGVVTALNAARDQASSGVRYLQTGDALPVDRNQVPGIFDAATMWLDLAVNLIDLDMRGGRPGTTIPVPRPGTPPMPPVTTMPVRPGEPGSPITILPVPGDLPEFDIQLPHPDSPVQ